MKILKTPDSMYAACAQRHHDGRRIGLVPTMGALHEGHLSLIRAARAQSDAVAVSIFVNPLQFGPNEDLAKYPRTLERDCQLLEAEKVDLLFAPSNQDMYPAGATTFVTVEGLSERLCGRSRPGHFRGVTTVVAKLFHIVEPDLAFFGQKDAAQVAIICRMVRDLNFPVRIVICPIVREKDGLAMSSRNAYLDPQQRKQALALYRSLMRVQTLADTGERSTAKLVEAGKDVIAEEPGVRLDYFEVVNPETLDPVSDISHGALVAVAAFVGSTRLIDNVVLHGASESREPSVG
ncbi:MAG: pantoate--beta-alanine ligase [Acidobacteriia bacterium]|nr:pantoate--beta-alanine ligase [Terriglobia bacterium]